MKLGWVMIAAIPWRRIMSKRRCRSRRAEQTLLFLPPAPGPEWSELPPPQREELMALVSKILCDAYDGKRSASGEVIDE
jgi:hypothetical protein